METKAHRRTASQNWVYQRRKEDLIGNIVNIASHPLDPEGANLSFT